MEKEKIEFWTYGCENGNIVINFEQGQKYIEVRPKDIVSMASWIMMNQDTYRPDWYRGLIKTK